MMVALCGVTYAEDLRDIAVFRYTEGIAVEKEVEKEDREQDMEAANVLLNLL